MDEMEPWFLSARTSWIILAAFAAAVLLHAWWRSRGAATPDPIRASGPID